MLFFFISLYDAVVFMYKGSYVMNPLCYCVGINNVLAYTDLIEFKLCGLYDDVRNGRCGRMMSS